MSGRDLRMEWDQIADRWAAMAYRLRSDTVGPLISAAEPRGTVGSTQGTEGQRSGKILPKTAEADTRPLSNQ